MNSGVSRRLDRGQHRVDRDASDTDHDSNGKNKKRRFSALRVCLLLAVLLVLGLGSSARLVFVLHKNTLAGVRDSYLFDPDAPPPLRPPPQATNDAETRTSVGQTKTGVTTATVMGATKAKTGIVPRIKQAVAATATANTTAAATATATLPAATLMAIENKERPPACTRDVLLEVRSQLNPELCPSALLMPWNMLCSITWATKCVDAGNWLEDYYRDLYYATTTAHREKTSTTTSTTTAPTTSATEDFLGFSVGCNKGFDALHTLRMGTYDTSLNKKSWLSAMEDDGEKLQRSRCNQDSAGEFELPAVSSAGSRGTTTSDQHLRKGEVHCFEPVPQTFERLRYSADHLGYDRKGFRVVQAAVSKESGTALFESGNKKGVESAGMDACKGMRNKKKSEFCSEVKLLTLKEYVDEHIDNNNNNQKPRTINHLSIDVEGYDGDVILGAGTKLLKRVEYLEFEYNWMGSWAKQHIFDVLSYLDGSGSSNNTYYREATKNEADPEELSFTCYWAGENRLWRITGCWMRYYDVHTWSNIACVNRKLVPELATKMETVFRTTLKEEPLVGDRRRKYRFMDPYWETLKKRKYPKKERGALRTHPMLATEPHEAMVSTEYL